MLRDHGQATAVLTYERRDERRVVVSLPGCYSLADREDTRGERRLFACRAVNISTRGMAVTAPVTAKIGVSVIADIEQIGRLKGLITREFKLGFVMSIAASNEERKAFAARITWVEKHKDREVPDNRAHARFIPRRPHSLLV